MPKNKGKKHAQQGNTSDKYVTKTEPEPTVAPGASTYIDKKLRSQMEKQKRDDEFNAAREAEQKKAAEVKKKQKTNKGNTPKKRIELPPFIKPAEEGFKGASESKVSSEAPKMKFESPRAAGPTYHQQKRDDGEESGFRGIEGGNTSKFSASKDYKHSRVHGPSYDLQKRDGSERGFKGPMEGANVPNFPAYNKHPRVEAPYYSQNSYNYEMQKRDKLFQEFMQRKNINCYHIKEEIGDLFLAPEEYSLAHCVAEDFNMGAGIALTFRAKFKQVSNLLNQNQRTGGLAVLQHEKRFIYYLVTKEISRGKPTLHTLWLSLLKLKQHCEENNVTKLAIPQIGCGLDKLDWLKVKQMLAHVFEGTPVEIVVYIWEKSATEDPQMSKTLRKCSVVHQVKPLTQIEPYTGLVYFAAMDGFETEQMANIAVRCPTLSSIYKLGPKSLGDAIRTPAGNDFIYGLVVKQNTDSTYNFLDMEKALRNLRDAVAKDKYEYVAFEGFVDNDDYIITDKIISLMQFILKEYVQIWVCWPDHLHHLCPPQY